MNLPGFPRTLPQGPVSGEASTYGLSQRKAYEMAVEEWNARGGILGRPIRLVLADDKGDPAEGVTAFTKVVERDKVAGILGATISRVSLAYDAAHLLFDAIRRAGSLEGPAIREALASTDLPLVTAHFRFDAHRNPIKSAAIIEIQGGRQVFRAQVAP